MPGVRGFSAHPAPPPPPPNVNANDLHSAPTPTLNLDELNESEQFEEPWQKCLSGMNLEQCQQIYDSLSQEQKDQLASYGLVPECCGLSATPEEAATMCRYVEFKGDASAMELENVMRISKGLRGDGLTFACDGTYRVRHADPESPIHILSECGDSRCGAHRLKFPEVRQRFRSFITRSIRRSKKDVAWWRDGLQYASLGSGHLLWDCEILERIRAEGIEIRQICLIDMAYAKPDDITLLVLQTFADWQAAVAELWDEPAPQVLAFPSAQAYFDHCGQGGVAAGCNLFMHCDAAWQGSDEECRRLAEKALVSTGLLARLNNLGGKQVPEEMLLKGPQMLRKYWQVQQEHSEEPFSAGAWLSHGDGDLEPLQDYLLGADPDEKAMRQLETDHRFKQAERARAEEIGLEVWRVRSLDPVKSRQQPSPNGQAFGEFSPGEVLIAAERQGDWIRVAGTSDLWGVEYSEEAKITVAAVPHAPGVQAQPTDDSSVWVPIDGSCLDMPSFGRFLEQIYVPPGRDPWALAEPLDPTERESLAVHKGSVTLKARRQRPDASEWSVELLRCPWSSHSPGTARQRQRERLHWRSVLHDSCGQNRKALLKALGPEERAQLRAFIKKEQRRWQALAVELSQMKGFARDLDAEVMDDQGFTPAMLLDSSELSRTADCLEMVRAEQGPHEKGFKILDRSNRPLGRDAVKALGPPEGATGGSNSMEIGYVKFVEKILPILKDQVLQLVAPQFLHNAQEYRIQRFVELLPNYDVVCLQELTVFWGIDSFVDLIRAHASSCGLKHFASSGRWPDWPATFAAAGLGVFSKYPIVRSEYSSFSRQAWFEWSAIQRGFLMVELEGPEGKRISVLNIHTTAGLEVLETGVGVSQNKASAVNPVGLDQLLEALLRFEAFSRGADQRIFCGDFNVSKDSLAFTRFREDALRRLKLVDVYPKSPPTFACVDETTGKPLETLLTKPGSQGHPRVIDHVFSVAW
ncbi:unnamed protein product [Durusdinium trenchii]|uniref:Endonuclease/exonuclease/phosphatase domain-containing protein n=1 Tax=Durusdinium trenchii TaxID=1381693 RepID=A0ABP0JZN6_9DINO